MVRVALITIVVVTISLSLAFGSPQFEREFAAAMESMSKGAAASNFETKGKEWTSYKEWRSGDQGIFGGGAGSGSGIRGGGGASSGASSTGDGDKSEGECPKDCVEEGELGPLDAPSIIRIARDPAGVYATLSSYKSYCKFAELLTGKPLASRDDLSKLCLHTRFTIDQNKIQGYSGEQVFISDCVKSKMGISATCTNNEGSTNKSPKSYPVKYSSVWTDETSNVLGVVCFSDGEKHWFLLSLDKTVSEDVKNTVIEKVLELGLDAKDVVDLSYDACKEKKFD